jgi:hypothetical protein
VALLSVFEIGMCFHFCHTYMALTIGFLGAAISVIANGPIMLCREKSDWEICVSVSLLVPVTWLKSLICTSSILANEPPLISLT